MKTLLAIILLSLSFIATAAAPATDKGGAQFNINDVIFAALSEVSDKEMDIARIPEESRERIAKQLYETSKANVINNGFTAANSRGGVSVCHEIIDSPLVLLMPEFVKYEIEGDKWISYKMSFWNANATLFDSQRAVEKLDRALVNQFGNKLLCLMVVSKIANALVVEYQAGKIKTEDDFYERAKELKEIVVTRDLKGLANTIRVPARALATGFTSSDFRDGKIVAAIYDQQEHRLRHIADSERIGKERDNFNSRNMITSYLISNFETKTVSGLQISQLAVGVIMFSVNSEIAWTPITIKNYSAVVREENPNFVPKQHNLILSPKEKHELLD